MELTTQAALVSALLALLVLLVGLARRDRRRRSAEADLDQREVVLSSLRDLAPAEPLVVGPPADQGSQEEASVDVQPDFDVATAPSRGWRARRRARRLAKAEAELEAELEVEAVSEVGADTGEALVPLAEDVPSVEEVPEPIEPVAAPRGWRARRRARRLAAAEAEALAADETADEIELPVEEEPASDELTVDAEPADEQDTDEQDFEQGDRVETAEQAELRALRAQVRTLEEVLQAQLAEHPTGLALVQRATAEPEEAYLRQVSLVVRGLAEHTAEDENPHRTLARVAAAVERLGAPNSMDRPVLPLPSDPPPHPRLGGPWKPSHRRDVAELVAPAAAPEAETIPVPGNVATLVEAPVLVEPVQQPPVQPVPEQFVPPMTQPIAEQVAQPMTQPMTQPIAEPMTEAVTEPVTEPVQALEPTESDFGLPASDEVEVVLPVPPPAQSQPQPNRRRFRR